MSGVELSAAQRQLIGRKLEKRGMKRSTGAAIGCAGQHLNQIVSGAKRPSPDLLAALCRELHLELEMGGVKIAGLQ